MENKNKKGPNNKFNKNKGPNFYKGKNNNNKNNKNKKKKNNADVIKENVVVNDDLVADDKFKFYENTMAINLDGYIDVNDDIVQDYAEEAVLISKEEDTLENMKREEFNNENDINPVDSVNINNVVDDFDDVFNFNVELVDGSDGLTDDDNLVNYDDIVAPDTEVVHHEHDAFEDTEVLDVTDIIGADDELVEDEIKYEESTDSFMEEVVPVEDKHHEEIKVEEKKEEKKVVNNTIKNNDNNKDDNSPNDRYYNFQARVSFMSLLSILAFVVSGVFIYQAINYSDIKDVVFSEYSSVNYSVCLNDNDYYNGECVGEGMQYISTLTKNIPVTFNYDMRYSDDVTYDVEYYILGKTLIYDRDDATKILYRDDKILKERTTIKGTDSFVRVSGKVDVAFKERNDYVNGYKSKYALNSLASYEVVLFIDDGHGPREVASATIPLSTQTFSISEETVLRENQQMTYKKVGLDSVNTVFAIFGVLFLIAGLFVVYKLFRLVYKTVGGNASVYQKKLNQILAEYDRVIVLSKNEYAVDPNKQLIKVDSFFELLDARDALEKPIIYEKVNSVKSFFYVEDDERIYRYAMKEADFEKKKK